MGISPPAISTDTLLFHPDNYTPEQPLNNLNMQADSFNSYQREPQPEAAMAESTATFQIHGISNNHELENIKDTLNHLNGVMEAEISPDGEADIRYDEDIIGGSQVQHRVEKMGYTTG